MRLADIRRDLQSLKSNVERCRARGMLDNSGDCSHSRNAVRVVLFDELETCQVCLEQETYSASWIPSVFNGGGIGQDEPL